MPRIALPTLSARRWNAMASKLAAKLNVRPGATRPSPAWRHPWNCLARFNPSALRWEVNIQPGFVNAQETEGPALPWRECSVETQSRLQARAGELVRPWLTESPWLPVRSDAWRAIGADAAGATTEEAVPPFFLQMGVVDQLEGGALTTRGFPVLPPEERRRLAAVDIVLNVPKPAPDIVLTELSDGIKRAEVGLRPPGPGELPSVRVQRRFVAAQAEPPLLAQVAAGRAAPPFQEWRVATLYLLSAPGAAPGSAPDHTWTPFAAHDLFWNRRFAFQSSLAGLPRLNLSFSTFLAGGVANPLFQGILEPINEADAQAALTLSRGDVLTAAWSV